MMKWLSPSLTSVTAEGKVVVVVDVQVVVVTRDAETQVRAIDVVTQGLTSPLDPMIHCGTESDFIAMNQPPRW